MNELRKKLGKLLKLERERQGLTLDDLSTQLKIPKSHLGHIETGDAEALPSELYFTLFAKSYAEALRIDYSQTVEAIKEDIGEPLEPESGYKQGKRDADAEGESVAEAASEPGEAKQATKYLKVWITVFGVIVILFFAFLLVNKFVLSSDEGESPLEEPGEASTETSLSVDREESSQSKFRNYDWNVPAYQEPADLQLKLVARSASWATVLADGDTAIFRSLIPGRLYEVTARYRLQISIAVPSVVDVTLNGQTVSLRDQITRRISRVRINQMNVDSFLNPQEPPVQAPNTVVENKSAQGNLDSASRSPTERVPSGDDADIAETGTDTTGKVDDER
jgi:cytoskeletal protein RodZ